MVVWQKCGRIRYKSESSSNITIHHQVHCRRTQKENGGGMGGWQVWVVNGRRVVVVVGSERVSGRC